MCASMFSKMLILTLLTLIPSLVAQEALSDLLIVGGYRDEFYIDDVEIVSIAGTSNCLKPDDYPIIAGGMAATIVAETALICGGVAVHFTSDCFTYDFNMGLWVPHGPMGVTRAYAGAVMLNDSHWWITGGYGEEGDWKSTELYNLEDNTFSPYIDLPVATFGHVLLKLDETHFFICCGSSGLDGKTYIFDLATEIWTETPPYQLTHVFGFAGS